MWLTSWLRSWKSTSTQERRWRGSARKSAAFRPRLEVLEARDLPSFSSAPSIPVYQPVGLVTADVNGDGIPDLITTNGSGITVSLGGSKGQFAGGRNYYYQGGTNTPTALAVADVNGDGKPDVILANDPGDGAFWGNTASISVFLNNGNGTFGAAQTYYVLPADAYALAVGDFNGDGRLDIVAGGYNQVTVLLNRGPGNQPGFFPVAQTYNLPGYGYTALAPSSVAVGDFNADGKPDIVATEYYGGTVNVLLNKGDGTGTFAAGQAYAVGGSPTSVAVGDFNADGKPDLAVTVVVPSATGNTYGVSVLLNLGNGTGAFAAARTYTVGGGTSVAVGDFNHDGKLDIVTTGAEMDVLLNNGNGTFGPAQKVGPAGSSVVVADFNADGFPDLAQIDGLGASIDVLLNNAGSQKKK
jgi:hypothetical protein